MSAIERRAHAAPAPTSGATAGLDLGQLERLRKQVQAVAPRDRGWWLDAWLSGACADAEQAHALRNACRDLLDASGLAPAPPKAAPALPAMAHAGAGELSLVTAVQFGARRR